MTQRHTSLASALRSPVAAACLLLLPIAATTLVTTSAHAQQGWGVRAEQRIDSVNITSDDRLTPGATLRFEVRATPDARAVDVRLGNSGVVVPLRERQNGVYTGTHVVRRGDRIDADDMVSVRVTHGDRTLARDFTLPPDFRQARGPATPAGQMIERFAMQPNGRLHAGQQLRYRLEGAPRGEASLSIPGVAERLAMRETRPGHYEATYIVRRSDDLDAFRDATATLRAGNQRAIARLDLPPGRDREDDRQGGRRDNDAPQIGGLLPADGARVGERGRTEVHASYSDGRGSGIDANSVRLRIGGRDVTRDARITDDEVHYRADLPVGRYVAELRVSDRAGNVTARSWTFEVVGERAGGPVFVPGPVATPTPPVPLPPPAPQLPPLTGPLTVAITSHANNATVIDDGKLRLVGRTAPNAEVRVHVDSISATPETRGQATQVLDQTFKADANGNFEVPVTPSGFVIPGARYEVRLSARYGNQVVSERLTLQRRAG